MNSLFDQVGSQRILPDGMVSDLLTRGNRSVSALNFAAMEVWAPPTQHPQEPSFSQEAGELADEHAQQIAVMMDAAREDAAEQTRVRMQLEWDLHQEKERARAERLTVEFARDRHRYFAAAETHVVRLALAVAQRILAREVAVNELPLQAAVHAALAKVQDDSETTLRVCPEQVAQWTQVFVHEPRIAVCGDADLLQDDCVLETRIGRIELGIAAQMQEIERGFDDLMTRTGD